MGRNGCGRTGVRGVGTLDALSGRPHDQISGERPVRELDGLSLLQTIPVFHLHLIGLRPLHIKLSCPVNLDGISITDHIVIDPERPETVTVHLDGL